MKKNIIIFLLLGIVVFALEFILFQPALKIGFKPDDWSLYFGYKILGSDPLSKIAEAWHERGAYTTYQIYYLGLLENLGGFNFFSFQFINLIFKFLGTLMIFPLILVIFKNSKLAVFTTILYAISFSSLGPLEFVVKGSDYLAIFFMCLFLVAYYYTIQTGKRIFLASSLVLLILTINFSPIRLYPLLFLIPLIEIYLFNKKRTAKNLKKVLIRIGVLYAPFIFILIYSPNAVMGFLGTPLSIYRGLIRGEWHLLLSTFSGIGGTFITNDYWGKIFGSIQAENFGEFLFFLSGGPAVVFGMLTLIVSFAISRKPWTFFISAFAANLILEIPVFFLSRSPFYDKTALYPVLFGIYILVLGFAGFIEWRKNWSNRLLLGVWSGALFLFVFSFMTWLFAPYGTYFSGTSYYLVVASIGSALFMSSLLLAVLKRILKFKHLFIKTALFLPVFTFIALFIYMSVKEINIRFNYLLANGRSAQGQQTIQQTFRNKIKTMDIKYPALFYFDTSDLSGEGPFYSEGFLESLPFFMRFEGSKLTDGCTEVLYLNQYSQLLQFVREEKGQKGFFYRSLCVEKGKGFYKELFYKTENFYAFKIKNRDFIDIKDEVLKELGFE